MILIYSEKTGKTVKTYANKHGKIYSNTFQGSRNLENLSYMNRRVQLTLGSSVLPIVYVFIAPMFGKCQKSSVLCSIFTSFSARDLCCHT